MIGPSLFILLAGMILICSCSGKSIPSHPGPLADSSLQEKTWSSSLSLPRKTIVRHAFLSIGTPYAWGGNSPENGFDCSGLAHYTYKKTGIDLPRTAQAQYKRGQAAPPWSILPGDLVFFKIPEKKKAIHVGIFTGENEFIHAPGKGRAVRTARLDNPYFKANYIGARSFFP